MVLLLLLEKLWRPTIRPVDLSLILIAGVLVKCTGAHSLNFRVRSGSIQLPRSKYWKTPSVNASVCIILYITTDVRLKKLVSNARIFQRLAIDINSYLNLDSHRSNLCLLCLGIHTLLSKLTSTPMTCVFRHKFVIIIGLKSQSCALGSMCAITLIVALRVASAFLSSGRTSVNVRIAAVF